MSDSRFWRVVAVLAVAGMFSIGHGLHRGGEVSSVGLTTQALASGVAFVDEARGLLVVTSSPDGKTVYYYGQQGLRPGLKFLGKLSAQ